MSSKDISNFTWNQFQCPPKNDLFHSTKRSKTLSHFKDLKPVLHPSTWWILPLDSWPTVLWQLQDLELCLLLPSHHQWGWMIWGVVFSWTATDSGLTQCMDLLQWMLAIKFRTQTRSCQSLRSQGLGSPGEGSESLAQSGSSHSSIMAACYTHCTAQEIIIVILPHVVPLQNNLIPLDSNCNSAFCWAGN
jgi:hypothetical protein